MQAVDERLIELEQRLTARDHYEAPGCPVAEPLARDLFGEQLGACKLASAQKVGIAELANRRQPIFFTTSPKIASRKSQKDCGSTCICTLSLEGIEDFLDRIGHTDASAKPFARNWQASQRPHGSPAGLGS